MEFIRVRGNSVERGDTELASTQLHLTIEQTPLLRTVFRGIW